MNNLADYGWYALLAAAAGDLLTAAILARFYKGYSGLTMPISALGNPQSPVRRPFRCWMFAEGVLFLLALPAVCRKYRPVSGGLTVQLIAFIAVFAVGACIFTAFFSVNETKDVVTTASALHGVGSIAGFTLFLFVPLLIAVLSLKNGEPVTGGVSLACFLAAQISFILFVMSDKEKFAGTFIANEGLWQRLNLFFMYLPCVIVSVKSLLQLR